MSIPINTSPAVVRSGVSTSKESQLSLDEKREARRKSNAKYRSKNADKISKQQAEYYRKNADKISKRDAEYRRKNADKIRKRNLEYIRKNRDKVRKMGARYRRKNADKVRKRSAEYIRKNLDKVRKNQSEWRRKNADKLRKYSAEYYRKNTDKLRKTKAEYRRKNADKVRKKSAEYSRRIEVRIVRDQRSRLKQIIGSTSVRRHEMTGCTPKQLRDHIESQFVKGMTWENQGRWHIDHIMPCSAFDLTKPDQVKVCFNWQNLRPIWAKKNLRKGKKITHPQLCLPIGIAQQTNQEKL